MCFQSLIQYLSSLKNYNINDQVDIPNFKAPTSSAVSITNLPISILNIVVLIVRIIDILL